MPVQLYLRSLKEKEFNSNEDKEDVCIDKFVWNPSNIQAFKDSFDSDEARTRLEHGINMIDVDMNNALHVFNSSIKEMAELMKTRIVVNKHRKSHDWFDSECSINRRNVRKRPRKYRRTLKVDDRNAFRTARPEYKNLLKNKKKENKQTNKQKNNDTLLNML